MRRSLTRFRRPTRGSRDQSGEVPRRLPREPPRHRERVFQGGNAGGEQPSVMGSLVKLEDNRMDDAHQKVWDRLKETNFRSVRSFHSRKERPMKI